MREIKFRGKSIHTFSKGEWVYGYLVELVKKERLFIGQWKAIGGDATIKDELFQSYIPVDPETVGQYTGLKDKGGREIYDGDICNCREYECYGKVAWNDDEAGFYFCISYEDGTFEEERLYDYADALEVIGNIHDNPELLEVEP